jgi:hypothetical protein
MSHYSMIGHGSTWYNSIDPNRPRPYRLHAQQYEKICGLSKRTIWKCYSCWWPTDFYIDPPPPQKKTAIFCWITLGFIFHFNPNFWKTLCNIQVHGTNHSEIMASTLKKSNTRPKQSKFVCSTAPSYSKHFFLTKPRPNALYFFGRGAYFL